ncbi:MAG: excisionase [Comamonadaceae bacterium]|nr:MAG: excisionase [Comamonadaceae bacterium]
MLDTTSTTRFVRIRKFVEMSGYTEQAVRSKIKDGRWIEGREYRRAPDAAILVDLVGFERWVARSD